MSNVIFINDDFEFDVTVPLIVVGAGAAGLIAALAASDSKVQVLVVERDASPGGSTSLSSGLIPACETRWQASAEVEDNVAIFMDDIQRKNKKQADEKLLKKVCSISGEVLHWLTDKHDQEFKLVDDFLYPGHSLHRMHCHPKRSGKAFIDNLWFAAEKAGIDVITSAIVTDIFASKSSHVRGIRISRPDGTAENIGCDYIIFACNGYGGNPAMVSKYIPEMEDAMYFGHQGNRGDAIKWGIKLGAAVKHMGSYQGHGSVATPHGVLITWAIMMEGGIQINTAGKRFSNEHEGYSEQAIKVLRQPGGIAWNIYDERLHKLALKFGDYKGAFKNGAVRSFTSIDNLATDIGVSKEVIAASLEELKAFKVGLKKCPFGRNFWQTKILSGPPYYGVKVTGALFHTQGGLEIDTDAFVLKKDGLKLPNLLASGGAAVGVSGKGVAGYLSGNGLLTAITLGYISGQSAARLIGGDYKNIAKSMPHPEGRAL